MVYLWTCLKGYFLSFVSPCLSVYTEYVPTIELGCGLGATLALMLMMFVIYHVFWLELLLVYRSWFGSDERYTGENTHINPHSYACGLLWSEMKRISYLYRRQAVRRVHLICTKQWRRGVCAVDAASGSRDRVRLLRVRFRQRQSPWRKWVVRVCVCMSERVWPY